MFLDDIVGPMSMKEAQETYKKVTKPVAQPRKLNPGWALDSTTKAELKRRKDLSQRKGIDESLNICKVCGQTPCNCTHIISENAWNDGTNDWTSEHDQWTKESVETIVPLTGVDEDGMIGPDSTSPIHGGMNEQRLSVGDPIIVTAPNAYKGKTGDIVEFSPSGRFVIVNLYNHGEHSMHLSDVEYNEYADQEDEVDEGWSDAIVAQRTGKPRTPYSVYIKGRKWKDFENDNHAEAVANKLRAKFKAEGRDPGVITIAPTDYDNDIEEAGNPAQQAAIAIAKKKEQGVAEADPNAPYTSSPAKPFRNPPGFNKQGTGVGNKLAQQNRAELANIKPSKGTPVPAKDFAQGIEKDLQKAMTKPKIQVKKNKGVAESTGDLRTELARVYRAMAPGIERHRDSHKAGELYDALEAVADKHNAHREFTRIIGGAKNRAHMEYDTNPGGFENWFWFLPFATDEQGIDEVKQRLDAKCWAGKHKEGTKIKGGVRVNNCVPNEGVAESYWTKLQNEKNSKLNSLVTELAESLKK
jgi:hypothetical protein